MIKLSDKHVYLALLLAIAAAVSSGSYREGLYRHVSELLLTNSGMEAGLDAVSAGAGSDTLAAR